MTLALAWVATRSDGREDLYFASDSRTRGALVLDSSPKILMLPRSDCAICFAGDTFATYPLMLHLSVAIAAHPPARDRNLDIGELKSHLLRVFGDILQRVEDAVNPLKPDEVQFLFGGYSWRSKCFRVWTIYYHATSKKFQARESITFHERLTKIAFIGDWAVPFRSKLVKALNEARQGRKVEFEPLLLLSGILRNAKIEDTIGGAPQVVRIGAHMNIRPLCVFWGPDKTPHLFGRPLFDYEHCDFWSMDPDSGAIHPPRHFQLGQKTKIVRASAVSG
jgi:hypothetical protein